MLTCRPLSAQVYHFCAYAGKLPTGPFLELFSELPGDLYGLLEWLQLRPHHAPLLTTLMGIIQSSNRNHQVIWSPMH